MKCRMMSNGPIGIFDSGVGGTSIWKEIHQRLPKESTLYLADSKNAPYGEKDKDTILQLSIKNTEFLIDKGCKIIVVACNTATTNAIDYLRKHYSIPFIGIEPAIKPAAIQSRTKTIGILATKGTLSSALFHKTADLYSSGIRVIEQIGEGLVPLIESGNTSGGVLRELLIQYLLPMLDAHIDHLVLGCTHYPYLIPEIRKILPDTVKIVDSGAAVARQTEVVLVKNGLINTSSNEVSHEFYNNLDAQIMLRFLADVEATLNICFLDF